jgi:hypothetical protein
MPFPESVKRRVRELAAFRCCRCLNIGIEVHHIVPEREGGASDEQNAAPLCAKCHADFGDNPIKRAEIRQMRDWWYNTVRTRPQILNPHVANVDRFLGIGDLPNLRAELREMIEDQISAISAESAQPIASMIVNASTGFESTKLADRVYANFACRNCNTQIGLLVGTDKCPNCGYPIGR